MIAWCLEENKAYPVLIRNDRTVFRCLEHDLYFLKNQNEILLRLPHEITYASRSRITHESTLSLVNQDNGKHCVICFSGYDEHYGKFKRFETKDVLTIGSSIEDDLYIQDHHFQKRHISIHFKEGIIEDHSGFPMIFFNDHYLKKETFQNGDILRAMNLQIVLHHDFVMINSVGNLYHSLKKYNPGNNEAMLSEKKNRIVIRKYRSTELSREIPIDLEEPKSLEKPRRQPLIFMMGPAMTMSSATLAAGFLSAYNGYLNGRKTEEMLPMILLPCMMLISTMLWNPLQRKYDKRMDQKDRKQRILDYTMYLDHLQQKIISFENHYFLSATENVPFQIENLFEKELIYQKLPVHADWLCVNAGKGDISFHYQIHRSFHLSESDPLHKMTSDTLNEHACMHGDAILPLNQFHMIAVSGAAREQFMEYILAQLIASHGPDLLRMVFACDEEWLEKHAWVRHIPHTLSPSSMRMIIHLQSQISELLNHLVQDSCHSVIVISTQPGIVKMIKDERIHFIVLCKDSVPPEADLRICINGKKCEIEEKECYECVCDIPSSFCIENTIESLNDYSIGKQSMGIENIDFLSLHDVETAASLNVLKKWYSNKCRDGIRCILGISENNEKIILDLHEKGMGPHGLIAGTTGSGKSELIISMILSLTIQYSPMELQFVLIDFKGGGAAQVFSNETYTIPHMAGILSNLDMEQMERALISFNNECHRREILFKKMSAVTCQPVMNLDTYQSLWQKEFNLPYIASLIIIVDEFAELKKEKPDFMKDLISIARVGRSLGIHLILSTQKPSGVVDDQIWSNSRFKICLKVQERQDSMEILHDPSASLIRRPGEFYFLYDGMTVHARSGYAGAIDDKEPASIEIMNWMNHVSAQIQEKKEHRVKQSSSVIHEIKAADQIYGVKAEQLWLSPIDNAVLPDSYPPDIYLGIADDYYHKKQNWVRFDPASDQHLAVFSIQRDEKISFLRTILKGMISIDDENKEIFLIDDLNIKHAILSESPFICNIFSSDDKEAIRNLCRHISERKVDEKGECFILIDDLSSFYSAEEENKAFLHHLLEISTQHTVHFVLLMTSASVLPYRDLVLVPFRICLANENEQDLGQIFERPVHRKVSRGHGMIYDGNLLDMTLLKTSEEELSDTVKISIQQHGKKKNYILPKIPARISLKTYPGKETGLGIDIQTYQWVEINRKQTLIILATYEEELYEMRNFWKKQMKNVLIFPNEKEMQNLLNSHENAFVFLTLDAYKISPFRLLSRKMPFLYVGKGFREQYDFSISTWKGEMKENYGVFFQGGRKQVIQIAETAE